MKKDAQLSNLQNNSSSSGSTVTNEDFIGAKFSILTGSVFEQIINDNVGNNTFEHFNNLTDMINAVKNKKVNATVIDIPVAVNYIIQHPEFKRTANLLTRDNYGIAVKKGNQELISNLNNFYNDIFYDTNTFQQMNSRWIDNKNIATMLEIKLSKTNGTLKVAISTDMKPFVFYDDNGNLVGFDVEYAKRFAQFMNMDIEFITMNFEDILPAVQSGKVDIGMSLITITADRRKIVDFAQPYYSAGTIIVYIDAPNQK